ncbi:MAG: STAS domain-containing protein [Oscillospiraceae bacterium]|nr:STAS domain-containing protein [Oscillospiraceae bacterium]
MISINKVKEDGRVVLFLSGRLDTASAADLQSVLLDELDSEKNVVLDFMNVEYISSAGLRVLLLGEKKAIKTGAKQTLTNVSEDIMEVLRITGFSNILTILPMEEAVQ